MGLRRAVDFRKRRLSKQQSKGGASTTDGGPGFTRAARRQSETTIRPANRVIPYVRHRWAQARSLLRNRASRPAPTNSNQGNTAFRRSWAYRLPTGNPFTRLTDVLVRLRRNPGAPANALLSLQVSCPASCQRNTDPEANRQCTCRTRAIRIIFTPRIDPAHYTAVQHKHVQSRKRE